MPADAPDTVDASATPAVTIPTRLPPARPASGYRLRLMGALLGLGVVAAAFVLPPLGGLDVAAQRVLGLVLFIAMWCAFRVVSEGLTALVFLLLAIVAGIAPAAEVMSGWTDPITWFNVAAFAIGFGIQTTGLGRRLALAVLHRTGLHYGWLVAVIFAVSAIFSLFGLAAAGRMAVFLPIIAHVAVAVGLKPSDAGYRGLVVAALAASTSGGLLLLTGAAMNPLAMKLAGSTILYSQWLVLFTPVAAAIMLVLAVLIPRLWPIPRPLQAQGPRPATAEMGPINAGEWRLLAVMGLAILLWNLDFWHGIHPGWVALLAAVLLMLPGLGMFRFEEFMRVCGWNTVFFTAAILSAGHLITYTRLDRWLSTQLTALPLPASAPVFLAAVAFLALLLHVPLASPLAAVSVITPAVAVYGAGLGYRPEIIAFAVHAMMWAQFFLPYQHVAAIYAMDQPGFYRADVYRYGLVSALVVVAVLVLVGIPYWSLLGVMR